MHTDSPGPVRAWTMLRTHRYHDDHANLIEPIVKMHYPGMLRSSAYAHAVFWTVCLVSLLLSLMVSLIMLLMLLPLFARRHLEWQSSRNRAKLSIFQLAHASLSIHARFARHAPKHAFASCLKRAQTIDLHPCQRTTILGNELANRTVEGIVVL
jgi:hypothetical protein